MSASLQSRLINRFPGWLLLLAALTALGPLSIDLYLPAFPSIERGLDAAPGSIELTLSAFFIGMALGQLFYGPFSDRFGRKKPLYVGLILYVLASLGCMLAQNASQLVFFRFLEALGGCAGVVIARAIVRDRCTPKQSAQAFSALILVMGLAPILAPLIGGFLLPWTGWRLLFLLLTLFGLSCLVMVHWGLEETRDSRFVHPLRLGQVLRDYGHLLQDRGFIGHTLTGGLAMAGMFAYIAGSPFVLIELYGVQPQHYAFIFGSNALALIAASQLNAWRLNRKALNTLLRRALWVPAMTGLLLLILGLTPWVDWWLLWIGFFVFVGSLGYINPNASAAALAGQGEQAGTASALMGAVQFLLATVAGMLVGLWRSDSALPLLGVMAVCGCGAWCMHRWLVDPFSRRAEQSL